MPKKKQSYKIRADDKPTPGSDTACPTGLKAEDTYGLENIPAYLIFTRLTEDTNSCMNCCVAHIGGSKVIHTTLYLPILEQTYTAVKDTGARCRDVHDFTELQQHESQHIYEFRMNYDQLCDMKESIRVHLNEPYDVRMVLFGWMHFICGRDAMDTCCTTQGTQTCSRFVLDALVDGGIIQDIEKKHFILPSDVERVVKQRPFVFKRIPWEDMCRNTNEWYAKTCTARRGVHAIHNVDFLSRLGEQDDDYAFTRPVTAQIVAPAAGAVSPSAYYYSGQSMSSASSASSKSSASVYSFGNDSDAASSHFDPSQYVYLDDVIG